jgi:toxin ParE1/3/4
MSRYDLSAPAFWDLEEIWSYYAVDLADVDLADRIRDEIFDGIRTVAKSPGIGHRRHDLCDEPVRFRKVRKYLIIYREHGDAIDVVRVLHAARDVEAVLDE